MKRLLLLRLAVVLLLTLTVPALANPGNGPPDMATGSCTRQAYDFQFKASGSLADAKGSIFFEYTDPAWPYWFDFEVVSYHRYSETQAAFMGALKATNHPGWPVGTTQGVLWVKDNGEGAQAPAPDKLFFVFGGLDYGDEWLTDWIYIDNEGNEQSVEDAIQTRPIDSGNIQVKGAVP